MTSRRQSRTRAQLVDVIEYTRAEAHLLWSIHDMPGPWAPAIIAVIDGKKEKNNG